MSRVLGGTYVKTGQESLALTADDLFDKIINLKFVRKSTASFTLRSDYEPVFHRDGTVSFKRCVQKPHIKVSYEQVSNAAAIKVGIEITNFFIGDLEAEDPKDMNTVEGDPVMWIIVQMGYINQFPDWTAPERRNNISQFYDLNNNGLTSDAEVRRGRQILVQVLSSYQKSYPPDMVTYFEGIIGTMETGLYWNHTEEDLTENYGDPAFPKDFRKVESVLFQFITRRFIKSGIEHQVITKDVKKEDGTVERVQEVEIYNLSQYRTGINNPDPQWERLELTESGIMKIEDAKQFGVVCAVSKLLREMEVDGLAGYGVSEEESDALTPIPFASFDDMMDTVGSQLLAIQNQYSFIRWYTMTDGSFYIYHVKESDEDLFTDPEIKSRQVEKTVLLPAIYDITLSGTRIIRCPFISFISPMSTVLFESRYTLSTLVGFYYHPKPGNDAFIVITAEVEFDTTGNENTMELTCIDIPKEEAPVIDPVTGKVKVRRPVPAVAEAQKKRNMAWTEHTLEVTLHKTGAMDTDSRWKNIVKNNVLADFRPELWGDRAAEANTEFAALTKLREWNPDFFDPDKKYMRRGVSIENAPEGIGGQTGIPVPWLYPAGYGDGPDHITVRHPYQPEYPEDQKDGV
jgi:hypothetical protein